MLGALSSRTGYLALRLALSFWHLISVLETGNFVVGWKVGLSQDLAATSNSKNAFSFICLACSGRQSLCTATTFSVEEIVVI